MKRQTLTILLLVLVVDVGCTGSLAQVSPATVSQSTRASSSRASQNVVAASSNQQSIARGSVPLPVFPLIVNYDYETKYFMQWIARCPQYSMISASVSKSEPASIQIALTATGSGDRVVYSNSEQRVKVLTQAGLNAHLVKIDYKTGEDADERRVFAFGFPDEHGNAIRWRFVAYGQSSDRGAGPRIQAVAAGLLISYNELGTTSAPSSLVMVGDKSYEVEEWPEISKPPYFTGYRGTFSEGLTQGLLLNGSENWRVESAPADLSEGARWILVDDRKFVRQLQITAKHDDELTITELVDKSAFAPAIEMGAKIVGPNFALKSMTQKVGANAMRISFTPELNLSPGQSAATEHAFQIDENAHPKVLLGTATLEARGGTLILKLRPKIETSRQSSVPKDYVLTATITVGASGYKVDVH